MKTMRTARAALVGAGVLMGAAAPLGGQEPAPFSPLAVFQMAERQEWLVRVWSAGGGSVVGRVLEADGASVRLEGGVVRLSDVTLVERGEPKASGAIRGAVIGGALLGGLAALLLYVVPIDGAEDMDEGEVLAGVSAGAGLGAIIGGLLGAAISPAATDWAPIWPGSSVDRGR